MKKATVSFIISVHPHGATQLSLDGFSWYFIFDYFKYHYNLIKITGTLHEDVCTFMMISRSVSLRMRNVFDNNCREDQNTYFMFSKLCHLWDNMEKYGRARQATDDSIIPSMQCACWVTEAVDGHSKYVILICLSMVTMVMRTRLYVMFIHTLPSCYAGKML
jgi:hypothetical protein